VDLIIHKVAWHQMNNILTVTLACFVLIYLMGNRNEARDHVLRYSVFFGEFIDGTSVATVFSDLLCTFFWLFSVGNFPAYTPNCDVIQHRIAQSTRLSCCSTQPKTSLNRAAHPNTMHVRPNATRYTPLSFHPTTAASRFQSRGCFKSRTGIGWTSRSTQ
jgi:hypothetical protein